MTKLWRSGLPLAVLTDDNGAPQSFEWHRDVHHTNTICNSWRVHSDWWKSSILWRDYYKIETTDGVLCIIYHDLVTDAWHLAQIYD